VGFWDMDIVCEGILLGTVWLRRGCGVWHDGMVHGTMVNASYGT